MKSSLKNFLAIAVIIIIMLCFGCPFSGLGANATVLVGSGGLVFTPATTNITVNDQVIWSWAGSPHSTTSGTNGVAGDDNGVPSGLWNSTVSFSPHSFTNTFTSAGTFSYYCSVHFSEGMTGMIIVAAPDVPPTITITNPVVGTVFAAPANVNIQVSAADSDGIVTNVQFLVGSAVLTNETAAPFSALTNNLAAGSYTFSAVATDNAGLTATNAVTISIVTPMQVTLGAPTQLSSTNFQFSYSADVGLTYVIQRSTDLTSSGWIGIFTNIATSNPMIFVDSNAMNNPGFYRVGLLPNP
jgi:plastocyanin